ncbi:autotransporter secretion outer membrane protein TamA [Limnobacter thiooxidans]|uniref:Autotransporter assembly complex family protein n=1 Tax=Limnobacter thiooxidans TaxID=131080 RepID=A0AA86IXC6_9BURK|nr:autotransporter secretion outer membrane protein TamA [Limnobacter thiooxidans]BET24887.1 autotransporter assembly complex family protein [Limnobacter thiooxidans]
MFKLRLLFACCFVLVGVFVQPAQAQEEVSPEERPVVNFVVADEFKTLVEQATEQIRSTAQVNDNGDAWQLFRRMRPVIRDVLGTEGHFSPSIQRVVDESLPEDAPAPLNIKIEPGPQSTVTSVDIQFDGEINKDEFAARRERLKTLWLLGTNQAFNQTDWSASKDNLLRDLLAKDFAAATLSESQANVDPDTNTVTLRVVYDSGPVFTFGELKIKGLNKYRNDLVARYNTIQPGDRYEQERLLTLLADLQGTSYFSAVDVKIDTDDRQPERVPIEVTVLESDSKRVGLGAGYSSNTGFRTEATYQYNNLFDRAYSLVTGVRVEQKRQSAFADVFLPPSRRGMSDSVGVAFDHQQISNLEVDRSSIGAIREYTQGINEYRLGLNFQLEERSALGVNFGATQALVASSSWTRAAVDNRLNPSDGYIAFGQVAVAGEQFASDQSFMRLYGRFQQFWSPSPEHLFTARFEAGTVAASARRDIPQDYLFRAGGTNSIRGYDFLDVGVLDQGVLVGGRRVMIGTLEYVRWFNGPLGAAVFTDVGDVADNWSSFDPKPAVGIGVRYKTPAGPIAFDVAKAADQDNLRIHFALGVAF